MKNIVIFGAPGAGKGTQSDYIVERYGLTHISTGDLLRKEIADQTELGKRIKSIIKIINLFFFVNKFVNQISSSKYHQANTVIRMTSVQRLICQVL